MRTRLRRVPPRARAAGIGLLAWAAVPPSALLVAATSDAPLAAAALSHASVVNLLAGIAALATLIAFERPRSASPLAYARQLRARFLELQSTYDADSRRRPEGKEKEDDLDVPHEP